MLSTPRNNSSNGRVRTTGFTLVELLMVISVILILAGITFGISRGVQNAQARAKVKAELAAIAQGLEQFKMTYGDYPHIEADGSYAPNASSFPQANLALRALIGWTKLERSGSSVVMTALATAADRGKLFIDPEKIGKSGDIPVSTVPTSQFLMDPWGRPYVYIYDVSSGSWENFGYVLFSMGPDGKVDMGGAETDGLIDIAFRDHQDNRDNIFLGE